MIQQLRETVARFVASVVFIVTFGQVSVDPTGRATSNREAPPAISAKADADRDDQGQRDDAPGDADEKVTR